MNDNQSNNKFITIKTGLSQAYWCNTRNSTNGVAKFETAKVAFNDGTGQALSWFDNLFDQGLKLPADISDNKSGDHPLIMLVSGPPGSGKTTLISELCYRLAHNTQEESTDKLNSKALSTIFISTDAETERMIQNAVDLGWSHADSCFVPFNPTQDYQIAGNSPSLVAVWGRENFMDKFGKQETLVALAETALNSISNWSKIEPSESFLNKIKNSFVFDPLKEIYIPDILVVDSLNILNLEGKVKYFQSFVKACKATKLVIFVLNTGTENQEHNMWEYFSDIVIHLDYRYIRDYYLRTIEVIKTRYQYHRLGKHQLKIYPYRKGLPEPKKAVSEGDREYYKKVQEYNIRKRRLHPYRTSGGVFIFPSIHYYLSVYNRKTSPKITEDDDKPKYKLNTIFTIPRGKCTAFIGQRGRHKSLLGYSYLLHRLRWHDNESGLIISLREDEATTRRTLDNIWGMETAVGRKTNPLDRWEKDNRLEVLYFCPGYITPEEFFHRVFISVQRLKSNHKTLTVVFNSIDQIPARFPLCAKEEIFIPGLIQALCGEDVTSICVAVDEPGQPLQKYGLLPMADLIVSFSLHQFSLQEYYEIIKKGQESLKENYLLHTTKFGKLQKKAKDPSLRHEAVVLQVIRFAGGERAGKMGMLDLVNEQELHDFPYSKKGLYVTPLSEEFSQLIRQQKCEKSGSIIDMFQIN